MYLQKAKTLLKDLKTVGCTIEEVQELEKVLNVFLPDSYKEFLLWMGKDSGGFLQGSDFLYPQIVNLQNWANELLTEKNIEVENSFLYFVFFMHGGYTFSCFSLTEHDDPNVYSYTESDGSNLRCLDVTFSQWLEVEAFLHLHYSRYT